MGTKIVKKMNWKKKKNDLKTEISKLKQAKREENADLDEIEANIEQKNVEINEINEKLENNLILDDIERRLEEKKLKKADLQANNISSKSVLKAMKTILDKVKQELSKHLIQITLAKQTQNLSIAFYPQINILKNKLANHDLSAIEY